MLAAAPCKRDVDAGRAPVGANGSAGVQEAPPHVSNLAPAWMLVDPSLRHLRREPLDRFAQAILGSHPCRDDGSCSPLSNRPVECGELRNRDTDAGQYDSARERPVDHEFPALVDTVIGDDLLDNARSKVRQKFVDSAVFAYVRR